MRDHNKKLYSLVNEEGKRIIERAVDDFAGSWQEWENLEWGCCSWACGGSAQLDSFKSFKAWLETAAWDAKNAWRESDGNEWWHLFIVCFYVSGNQSRCIAGFSNSPSSSHIVIQELWKHHISSIEETPHITIHATSLCQYPATSTSKQETKQRSFQTFTSQLPLPRHSPSLQQS